MNAKINSENPQNIHYIKGIQNVFLKRLVVSATLKNTVHN